MSFYLHMHAFCTPAVLCATTVYNMLDVLVINTANLCHILQDTHIACVTF